MRVLFIGGTGLISSACTRLAVERGMKVCLLNRGQRAGEVPAGAEVLHADIRQPDAAAAALAGRTFDAVVDFIAYTPEHIETDIRLFAGRTAQFVFISSASVYLKPLPHYLVTERTPLGNPFWEYARLKIACEERLDRERRERGFPATIVRPALTYGPQMIPHAVGVWAHPWTTIDRMRRGKKTIVHGDGTSPWCVTHNSDFAKGLVGLLGNPASVGEAFHITTDEVLTWDEIYRAEGRVAGAEPRLVHIASEFIAAFDPRKGQSLLGDKACGIVFDNTKIKRFVPDFRVTMKFEDGVRQSIVWFEADAARQTVDAAYDRLMDRIIEAHEAGMARGLL